MSSRQGTIIDRKEQLEKIKLHAESLVIMISNTLKDPEEIEKLGTRAWWDTLDNIEWDCQNIDEAVAALNGKKSE